MNLKKKNLLGWLMLLTVSYLLISGQSVSAANEQFDTVDTYEKNMFLPAFDIWVNQTAPAFGLGLNSIENNNQFQLVHYMLFPDSISMEDLQINDPSVRIRFGLFGQNMDELEAMADNPSTIDLNAFEDKSESGHTGYAARDTDRVNNYDVGEEILTDDAGVVITATFDHMEAAAVTSLDTLEQNYTIPDNDVRGVAYLAGDDKTIVDYGQDISEADGGTYQNIVNASVVGFAFESYSQLEGVYLGIEEESDTGALGLNGFAIKRGRISLHSVGSKVTKSAGGLWSNVKRTVDNTVFKPIKNAGDTLASIPNKAKHFFKETLPSWSHTLASKVGSVAKGIFGALKGLLPIIVVVLVIGMFFYFGWHKKLMRK